MSLEQLHIRGLPHHNLNPTICTIRDTRSYMHTLNTAKTYKSKSWLNIVKLLNLLQSNTDLNVQTEVRRDVTICPLNNWTYVVCHITISARQSVPFETPDRTWPHRIQPRPSSLNLGSTLSNFQIISIPIQTQCSNWGASRRYKMSLQQITEP